MLHKDDIGFLIKLIHDGINRVFHQEIGKNGPTRSQLNVIYYLMEHPGEKVLVKDIMEYLHVDQSTASGIIKRMERNGYITCRQDPADGRQKLISLVATGEGAAGMPPREGDREIERAILKGLSEDEREELRRMLKVIYDNIQAM